MSELNFCRYARVTMERFKACYEQTMLEHLDDEHLRQGYVKLLPIMLKVISGEVKPPDASLAKYGTYFHGKMADFTPMWQYKRLISSYSSAASALEIKSEDEFENFLCAYMGMNPETFAYDRPRKECKKLDYFKLAKDKAIDFLNKYEETIKDNPDDIELKESSKSFDIILKFIQEDKIPEKIIIKEALKSYDWYTNFYKNYQDLTLKAMTLVSGVGDYWKKQHNNPEYEKT